MKKKYEKVALIDLDIINMYFRIREKRELLEANGIEVYSSSLKESDNLDLPALDPQIIYPLRNEQYMVVIDCGGDPKGSLVLRRYKEFLTETNNLFVINRYREETSTKEKVLEYMKEIETYSNQRVHEILNTTHMLKETKKEDVLFGYELAKEVSDYTKLNLKFNVCKKSIAEEIKNDENISCEVKEKLFPIDLIFRDDWML